MARRIVARQRRCAAVPIVVGALAVVLAAAMLGIALQPPADGGRQAVYDGINTATSCESLATLFRAHSAAHDGFIASDQVDQAKTESGYVDAVIARKQRLGCP